MTISDFKLEAKNKGQFYDNSKVAGENWAKTWGLTYWRDVWFYKEYSLKNLVYRTGAVRMRHNSRQHVQCLIDGKEVSKNVFLRKLRSLPIPSFLSIPVQTSVADSSMPVEKNKVSVQLCFSFT